MHFFSHFSNCLAKSAGEFHLSAPPDLMIEKIGIGNFAAQHFFQAHGLAAELADIRLVLFIFSPFVFHGNHIPVSPVPMNYSAGIGRPEFHHVTLASHPQGGRRDPQPSRHKDPRSFLYETVLMGIPVHHFPFRRQPVICPLLFHMDQCPLPTAEDKVLYTGNHEVFLFRVSHIRSYAGRSHPGADCLYLRSLHSHRRNEVPCPHPFSVHGLFQTVYRMVRYQAHCHV